MVPLFIDLIRIKQKSGRINSEVHRPILPAQIQPNALKLTGWAEHHQIVPDFRQSLIAKGLPPMIKNNNLTYDYVDLSNLTPITRFGCKCPQI